MASMLRKLDGYLANGCRLVELVLPEQRTVLPGDALPRLAIELDELFG